MKTRLVKSVKKRFYYLALITLLGISNSILAQQNRVIDRYNGVDGYSVVFWNIENFFDLRPSPIHIETGFTPRGQMRWTRKRFNKKRDKLAKVLIATGFDGELPVIIGLAEIENRYVLNQLIYETPLYSGNYRIVHKDSPDSRGIDVALLYRRDLFRALHTQWIPVQTNILESFEVEEKIQAKESALVKTKDKINVAQFSRDILYVKGVLQDLDTVHLFVSHWPSKFGGEKVSGPKRLAAAMALARVCDSLLQINSNANILAMGDFNDTPNSKVFEPLKGLILLEHNLNFTNKEDRTKNITNYKERNAVEKSKGIDSSENSITIELKKMGIVNLKGTIKYKGVWEKIDHFFVSGNILDVNEPIYVIRQSVATFSAKYLLEKDKTYTGTKPYRTYIGPRYNGGLSDHLPIILKIKREW
ncbi:MAG: endonuclease/exonuclease/phosphatase family protein [Bacteroidales bacterium]